LYSKHQREAITPHVKLTAVQQHQAATHARLNAFLPAILDRAFKGEL